MKKDFTIDLIELPSTSIEDLEKTKNFMSSVFGWQYTAWGEDYADSTSSGTAHAFNAEAEHKPTMPMIVIYANDLEKTKAEVENQGGIIVKDTFSFPGGRRFHFIEPSGNLLAVWSDK
ncbi:Glyoxalase/bleomycin resistance protein/dioxygenase [uncultured Paludibacter sp.]|nr:Glyoxalase/bleomycin resistance protein/dioxygenase [uncultured Paludibacter sp.]